MSSMGGGGGGGRSGGYGYTESAVSQLSIEVSMEGATNGKQASTPEALALPSFLTESTVEET